MAPSKSLGNFGALPLELSYFVMDQLSQKDLANFRLASKGCAKAGERAAFQQVIFDHDTDNDVHAPGRIAARGLSHRVKHVKMRLGGKLAIQDPLQEHGSYGGGFNFWGKGHFQKFKLVTSIEVCMRPEILQAHEGWPCRHIFGDMLPNLYNATLRAIATFPNVKTLKLVNFPIGIFNVSRPLLPSPNQRKIQFELIQRASYSFHYLAVHLEELSLSVTLSGEDMFEGPTLKMFALAQCLDHLLKLRSMSINLFSDVYRVFDLTLFNESLFERTFILLEDFQMRACPKGAIIKGPTKLLDFLSRNQTIKRFRLTIPWVEMGSETQKKWLKFFDRMAQMSFPNLEIFYIEFQEVDPHFRLYDDEWKENDRNRYHPRDPDHGKLLYQKAIEQYCLRNKRWLEGAGCERKTVEECISGVLGEWGFEKVGGNGDDDDDDWETDGESEFE